MDLRSYSQAYHQQPSQQPLSQNQTQSESEISQKQLKQLQQNLHKQSQSQNLYLKNHRQFLVNTGLSFQITDYFKFQPQLALKQEHTIFKDVNQKSFIAWFLLLYSVISSAMIPPWLMTIKADKLLRVSWKCLFHLVMIIPFVLYQKRNANQKIAKQYQLNHIFSLKNIKKVWILAFTTSFWPTCILTSIQWTYISHCFVLGSLTNLFLCFERIYAGKYTRMQISGSIFAIIGILFIIYDSISLNVQSATDFQWNVFNYFYLTRKWWQRMLGDLAALTIGYCMSQLSKFTSDIKEYYPPFLSLFLNNFFTCIFMAFSGYFFNGATFDFNSQWGVFALFTSAHFTNFLFMSIVLTMGTFNSFILVTKIFNDSAVLAIAMTLQPIISTVLWHLAGVQTIPGPYACYGYLLVIPSSMIIIMGNCFKTRTKINQIQNKQMKKIKNIPPQTKQILQEIFDLKQY